MAPMGAPRAPQAWKSERIPRRQRASTREKAKKTGEAWGEEEQQRDRQKAHPHKGQWSYA